MPSKWDDSEVAVVVYFASRGASHEACRKILALKCAGRCASGQTLLAVRGKLYTVRQNSDLWSEASGWNRGAVDSWLLDLETKSLQDLVAVGEVELSMVPKVSCTPTIELDRVLIGEQESREGFQKAVNAPSIIHRAPSPVVEP